jgi:hypothetical protein
MVNFPIAEFVVCGDATMAANSGGRWSASRIVSWRSVASLSAVTRSENRLRRCGWVRASLGTQRYSLRSTADLRVCESILRYGTTVSEEATEILKLASSSRFTELRGLLSSWVFSSMIQEYLSPDCQFESSSTRATDLDSRSAMEEALWRLDTLLDPLSVEKRTSSPGSKGVTRYDSRRYIAAGKRQYAFSHGMMTPPSVVEAYFKSVSAGVLGE